MGLDLALGAVILLGGIRGWLRGFVSQAVRLGGFIACFYLADPVRDQARPYVLERLPKIDPALMDRILWWVSAVISYIVLVGLVTLTFQMMRNPPEPGMPRTRRNDQFGGFLFGAAKGLLVATFLAAAVHKYHDEIVKNTSWAGPQMTSSMALKWTEEYHPAPKIWESPPVRRFVEHIQQNGLKGTVEAGNPEVNKVAERPEAAATPRAPKLEVPPFEPSADSLQFDPEIAKTLEGIKAELRARGASPD